MQKMPSHMLLKNVWSISRMDHRLVHKGSINKITIEIISSIFPDQNGVKFEISDKRKAGKFTNT
jgi:hypothetical protein